MARREIYAARHTLARNLRRPRLVRGLRGIGRRGGLRQALISELESSKLDARLDTLNQVAIASDATMADLFDEAKRD
jgi:proteasome assembly chaperone (PAC2) family protein